MVSPAKENASCRTAHHCVMRRGATFLEYAMLAALIGIVGAVGVKFYGQQLKELFIDLGNKTAEVVPSSTSSSNSSN